MMKDWIGQELIKVMQDTDLMKQDIYTETVWHNTLSVNGNCLEYTIASFIRSLCFSFVMTICLKFVVA